MTFEISLGRDPILDACPDWLRDQLPVDASREKIASTMAVALMGDLRQPKTTKTVREKVLRRWEFLRALAEISPTQFDEVLLEYAERVTCTK